MSRPCCQHDTHAIFSGADIKKKFVLMNVDLFLSNDQVLVQTSMLRLTLTLLPHAIMASAAQQALASTQCSPQAILYPTLFGVEFLSLEAFPVSNFSKDVHQGYYINHGSVNVTNANFCNVSIAYTHPGQNDTINVQVWLPKPWNGRMQGIGGGGWAAGLFPLSYMSMVGAIGENYMAVTTDAGHVWMSTSDEPSVWAQVSPGNVNMYLLQDFGSVSLNEAAIIGKDVAQSFYGQRPRYSYFSGCSQGGRQGLMLAQRYPTAYDGIVASAPAIFWNEFIVGGYWPQQVMARVGYPRPCEVDALTAAAIAACDGNDGIIDGIIADADSCAFDPYELLGSTINCTSSGSSHTVQISRTAADVANASWTGPLTLSGSQLWYGVSHEAVLTGEFGIANTGCYPNGTCYGIPSNFSTDWIRLFVQKDPNFDFSNMTHLDYQHIFHASVQEFSSIIGTGDPDLAEFRRVGGKMLTYHGLVSHLLLATHPYHPASTAAMHTARDHNTDSLSMNGVVKD